MKARQKVLALLLVIFMLFSLVACTQDPTLLPLNTEPASDSVSTTTPDSTINTDPTPDSDPTPDTDPTPDSDPTPDTDPAPDSGSNTPPNPVPDDSPRFTINGAPISDWTIVLEQYNRDLRTTANEIVRFFAAYTGEQMAIAELDSLTGNEKNLICIGGIGRNWDFLSPFSGEYYLCEADEKGSVISLISTQKKTLTLVEHLKNAVTEEKNGEQIHLTVPEGEYIRFSIQDQYAAWNLKAELKRELYEGVTYVTQHFIDTDGDDYRTFALILDPEKVSIQMGCSNDGYDLTVDEKDRQTTEQHMKAAVANGANVIAGFNANFFNMDGDYSPKGLALKDGVVISPAGTSYPFFAVTEDGEYIIDEADEYRRYERNGKKFVHGVAGNEILMKDGLLTRVVDAGGLHPRTLVGLTEDGKIVLGVIDGRYPGHSNGASYASSAIWMRSLGARTVMNLDGGGSSNIILRDPLVNSYETCNFPSDGNLRKVYNSLLVVLKSEE